VLNRTFLCFVVELHAQILHFCNGYLGLFIAYLGISDMALFRWRFQLISCRTGCDILTEKPIQANVLFREDKKAEM
jgi:hypothetical protein